MTAASLSVSQLKPKTGVNLQELLSEPVREVGDQAVWSLSSCKAGYGVEQIRDDNINTYWQSDGPQPHMINIQFRKKTTLLSLALYADFKADESYTPSKLSFRTGTHFNDLKEFAQVELHEPCGWSVVELQKVDKPLKTFMIQVAVLQNHQNGRDTHIRQVKLYGPRVSPNTKSASELPDFNTVEMMQFTSIR